MVFFLDTLNGYVLVAKSFKSISKFINIHAEVRKKACLTYSISKNDWSIKYKYIVSQANGYDDECMLSTQNKVKIR